MFTVRWFAEESGDMSVSFANYIDALRFVLFLEEYGFAGEIVNP